MKYDVFLLVADAGERTISHRLAFYLQSKIHDADVNVDCEYNRVGFDIKKKTNSARRIYPDIIIHERGNNSNNILAIEIKKHGNKRMENDEMKLKELTSTEFRYRFGLLIIFHTKKNLENKPVYRWFSNGMEMKR